MSAGINFPSLGSFRKEEHYVAPFVRTLERDEFPSLGYFESREREFVLAIHAATISMDAEYDYDTELDYTKTVRERHPNYVEMALTHNRCLTDMQMADKTALFATEHFRALREEIFADMQAVIQPHLDSTVVKIEQYGTDWFSKALVALHLVDAEYETRRGGEIPIGEYEALVDKTLDKIANAAKMFRDEFPEASRSLSSHVDAAKLAIKFTGISQFTRLELK